MSHATPPTLRVLHALKVKGFAEPLAIAEATGLPEVEVEGIVGTLAEGGLATTVTLRASTARSSSRTRASSTPTSGSRRCARTGSCERSAASR
jgi:hypothetical protein